MFLLKLELQGFKTFAQKTTLSFLPPKGGVSPITAVVGPNGSGKSNFSDAIRWVLGEQSLKLLRGKESQDVIFSGSEGRGRSGFAEVSMTFNNEDHTMPIDFSEVTVTRRLYRDGNSEYLLNGSAARLSDIQLLLAQANVGQRSYSVIGQGMVDHILVSSPEERKAFFDDATGVKQFQIKRHESMLKLKRTYENLAEVEMLLTEIEPRLKSLKRQVSRLQEREEVEKKLRELEHGYFGTMWWQLTDELVGVKEKFSRLDIQVNKETSEVAALVEKVTAMEREEKDKDVQDDGLIVIQKQYNDMQRKRSGFRDEQFKVQKEIEMAKVRAQSNWAPLPLTKIIEGIEGVAGGLKGLRSLKGLDEIYARIDELLESSTTLVSRLQRPSPEDVVSDPKMIARVVELGEMIAGTEAELKTLEESMKMHAVTEKQVRTELFDLQRDLRQKQQAIHLVENQRNAVAIDLARLEERQANLGRDMDEQLKEQAGDIRGRRVEIKVDTNATYPEIQRLRYKLELIGGIDPEIVKEFEETNARFSFLDGQVSDLRSAVADTEKIIDELDEEIHKQSEKAFKKINDEFEKYFKMLFGGGSCSLVKMSREDVKKDAGDDLDEAVAQLGETEKIALRIREREDRVVGIDIQATPPGKKLKALNLLSGGERALTSIALVSAIMAVNPGPFVVLDEVDAALDEANTFRFAGILEELAKLTQFIVITHNRATMEKADVLYGVTMGDDGVSNLLSVNLSDVTAGASARH
ncbi:MAG: AAA family ATPase [Candidatus Uhrbacteria bacterium]